MSSSFGGLLLLACGGVASALACSALMGHYGRVSAVIAASQYSHASDTRRISPSYQYRFGLRSPFKPSNARTEDSGFLPPREFPNATCCGHCHAEAYKEWSESAHRSFFRAPFYKKNVDLLIKESRICGNFV